MDIEVILPKFGWTMEEALITDWLKQVGDRVEEDEPLFVIETDKANQEVPSPATGILREILFSRGETVPVGEIIAYLTQEEVSAEAAQPVSPQESPPSAEEQMGALYTVPVAGLRGVIAERMTTSLQSSAQLTLTTEVDLTATAAKRSDVISPTAIIVQVAARLLADHLLLNSYLVEDSIHVWAQRNVGIAVALPEGGLLVPVIRNADQKSAAELSEEISALSDQACSGSLPAAALSNGTFTVTNLGMYGIDAFTPILDPPQSAILGVGRWVEKPGIWDGKIVPRTYTVLSLTIDHRVIDGAPAAAFLQEMSQALFEGNFT